MLLAKLNARRAQAKAAAQLKKNEEFAKIEEQSKERIAQDQKAKDMLMENLRQEESQDTVDYGINTEAEQNTALMKEMEDKRRDEEQQRQHHERLQRRLQGEGEREYAKED